MSDNPMATSLLRALWLVCVCVWDVQRWLSKNIKKTTKESKKSNIPRYIVEHPWTPKRYDLIYNPIQLVRYISLINPSYCISHKPT